MVLEKEQGHLFYKLWLPLLNHANEKYQVVESFFGPDPSKGILPDKPHKKDVISSKVKTKA